MRPPRIPWTRCWPSFAGRSIPPARRSTIPPSCTGPTTRGGRLTVIWLQIQNYLLYFDWQWAKGLTGAAASTSPLRLLITIAAMIVGIRGFLAQRRFDRSGWWLLLRSSS